MKRLICLAALLAAPGQATAGLVLAFGPDTPATYEPGSPFAVDLRLEGAGDEGLVNYFVTLSLEGAGEAGVDYAFGALQPDPGFATGGLNATLSDLGDPGDYVFVGSVTRGSNQDVVPDGPTPTRLTLSLSDFAIVPTYGGAFLARLTVVTSAAYTGPLSIGIESADTQFFDEIGGEIARVEPGPVALAVIPEPASLALVAISALVAGAARSLRRFVAT